MAFPSFFCFWPYAKCQHNETRQKFKANMEFKKKEMFSVSAAMEALFGLFLNLIGPPCYLISLI